MKNSSQSSTQIKAQLKLKLLQTQIKKGLLQKSQLNYTIFQYNFERLAIKTLNTLAQYIKEKILEKLEDKNIVLIMTLIKDFEVSLKEYRMIYPHAENDKNDRKSAISSVLNKSLLSQINQDQKQIDQIQKFMMSRNLNLQLNLLENQDESYKNEQRNSINEYLTIVNIKEKNFQNQIRTSNQHRKTFCSSPEPKSRFFLKKNTLDVNCFQQILNQKQIRATITSKQTIQQVTQGEQAYSQTEYNLQNINWKKMEIYCRKKSNTRLQSLSGQIKTLSQEQNSMLVEFSMQTQAQPQVKQIIRDSVDSVQNNKKKTKKTDRNNKPTFNKLRSKGTKQQKKQQLQLQSNIKNIVFKPSLDMCFQIYNQTVLNTISSKQKSNFSSRHIKIYKPITIKDIIFSLQQNSSTGVPTMMKIGSYHKKNNQQDKKLNAENKFSSSRTLMIDQRSNENKKNRNQNQSEQNVTIVRKNLRQNTFNGFSQYSRNKKNGSVGQNSYQKSQLGSIDGSRKEGQTESDIQNQQSNNLSVVKKMQFNKTSQFQVQNRRQSRFKVKANQTKQFLQPPQLNSKFQSKRNSLQCMIESQDFNKGLKTLLPLFCHRNSNLSSQLSMFSQKKSENLVIHQDEFQKQSSSRKHIKDCQKEQKKMQELKLKREIVQQEQKKIFTPKPENILNSQQKMNKQKKFNVVIRNNSKNSKLKVQSSFLKHRKQSTMYDLRKQSNQKQNQLLNIKLNFNSNSKSQISLLKKSNNYQESKKIGHYFILKNGVTMDEEQNLEKLRTKMVTVDNTQRDYKQKQSSKNKLFKAKPLPKSQIPSINSQTSVKQLRKLLLTKKFRNQILLYLSMIEATHQKYCGENCIHVQNFYNDIIGDPKIQKNQTICSQILRVYKKNKV